MFNSKKFIVTAALALIWTGVQAQTIGDIAAFQRAKAQAELKGETPPANGQSKFPDLKSQPVAAQEPKKVDVKKIILVATYEVDGHKKALLNNQGSVSPFNLGDRVSHYTVRSITNDSVSLQSACKKSKKAKKTTNCKVNRILIGGGI